MRTLTPRKPRWSILAASVPLALFLLSTGGCPPTTQAPAAEPGVTDVKIENFTFSPKEVTIKKGESVRWQNNDAFAHTVTSGSPGDADVGQLFDSGNIASGKTFTQQFDEVGEFLYFCRIHSDMASMRGAKVIVQE